jgi:DNA-binding PadR family transcriptional regulator
MATKKRPSNLLALAVLSLLTERPMHPYEMSVMMRHRGHDENIKSSRGSIYTVVESLERDGLVEAQEPSREGRRPERTVYSITPAGSELFHAWLRDLLGTPTKEYPQFTAALMLVGHVGKDEIIEILQDRTDQMADRLQADKNARNQLAGLLPRIFMIEGEYDEAMRAAEINWLRKTIAEVKDGGYPWPVVGPDGPVKWDGNETFQVPQMTVEELAESAEAKQASYKESRAKGGEGKARK